MRDRNRSVAVAEVEARDVGPHGPPARPARVRAPVARNHEALEAAPGPLGERLDARVAEPVICEFSAMNLFWEWPVLSEWLVG